MDTVIDENRKQLFDDMFGAFSMLSDGNYVSLYDTKLSLTRYSPAAVELFGLPGEYIPDGAYNWVDFVHPDDKKRYEKVMGDLIALKTLSYNLTYRVLTKSGSYMLFRFIGAVIRTEDGKASLIGGKCVNEGLMENTDSITILPNQYAFAKDFASIVRGGKKHVVLMLGISKMSQINERNGYSYGNRVLQEFALALQEAACKSGKLYRMDGSKFALISPSLSEAEAAAFYENIRQKAAMGLKVDALRIKLMVNGALVSVKERKMSDRIALSCLNYAYRESKTRRHGTLVAFSGTALFDEGKSAELLEEIRNSIIDDCRGFFLRYQSVVDAKSGNVIGFEALLRWKDEFFGEIEPAAFLPILERDSLFSVLGDWILRQAMTEALEAVKADNSFLLGVNVSISQLEMEDFEENLLHIIAETHFPVSNLCIEFTESCRVLPVERLSEISSTLKAHGVKIAIDDFGSGTSSLEMLKELNADVVKFSYKFVKDIASDEKSRESLRHLCGMGAVYSKNVCVKGVESKEIYDILRDFPVNSLQGFLFSRPSDLKTAIYIKN